LIITGKLRILDPFAKIWLDIPVIIPEFLAASVYSYIFSFCDFLPV